MDENYQTYLNRAMRATLPDTHRAQVQHLQESPKFRLDPTGQLEPVPFQGYTIITPPGADDGVNAALYQQVAEYQQVALDILGPGKFAQLPPDSFHLTLADVIWHSAYRHAAENPSFEPNLRTCIGNIFQKYAALTEGSMIRFQPMGLMVMTRALAIALVPAESQSYERLVEFRRCVYQDPQLMGLGIEQQYYFTPHLTLGYFGELPAVEARAELTEQLAQLNQRWPSQDLPSFLVHRAELRKFDDMTRYCRELDWPTLEF